MHGFSQLSPTERREWMESRSPTPTPTAQQSLRKMAPKLIVASVAAIGIILLLVFLV